MKGKPKYLSKEALSSRVFRYDDDELGPSLLMNIQHDATHFNTNNYLTIIVGWWTDGKSRVGLWWEKDVCAVSMVAHLACLGRLAHDSSSCVYAARASKSVPWRQKRHECNEYIATLNDGMLRSIDGWDGTRSCRWYISVKEAWKQLGKVASVETDHAGWTCTIHVAHSANQMPRRLTT